eukprot:TRINITY_DN9519_c0_g1_i1.p1 TRINITY_DN9519_c0_g1~~TRINITY_DN9519_c0_g1_i1.p1  ORF type:complete len:392 (+),score=121.88 TRINITY_DN9519_c0_g1_i1:29-1177(+)
MARKVCLVTGGNAGIGYQIAKKILNEGHHVILGCRSKARADTAIASLKSELKDVDDRLDFMELDLSSFDSIDKFAKNFYERDLPLDVLVNNAGILPMSTDEKTVDGFEKTFAVNYLGPFLLTLHMMKALEKGQSPRIVSLSSLTHYQGWIDFDLLENWKLLSDQYDSQMVDVSLREYPLVYRGEAGTRGAFASSLLGQHTKTDLYTASKLAIQLFVQEFDRRFCSDRDFPLTINACCPGIVSSDILRDANWFIRFFGSKFMRIIGKNTEQGARTPAMLSTSPKLEGVSGKYFTNEVMLDPAPSVFDQVAARRLWDLSLVFTRASERVAGFDQLIRRQTISPLSPKTGPIRGLGIWYGWNSLSGLIVIPISVLLFAVAFLLFF